MRQSIVRNRAQAAVLMLLAMTGSGCGATLDTHGTRGDAVLPNGSAGGGVAIATDAGDTRGDPGRAGSDATPDEDASRVDDAAVDAGASIATPIPLIVPGESVFFVGNSFFGGGAEQLDVLVKNLGTVVTPAFPIETGTHIVYGVQPLSWFFQQPASQNAIASGSHDVFVLQGEEHEPVQNPEAFKQAVRDYHAAITAKGGRVLLFMTWEFSWEKDTTFFMQLVAAYEDIGRELDVPVIPVGLIYDDCNEEPFGAEPPYWLLVSQDIHQNQRGTLVNAYATFAMLTGINPLGVPVPGYEPAGLSPELHRYLSDKAWARVERRLAGVVGE